jgi:hypothetical protein
MVMNKLKCLILGHKRFKPKSLNGNHILLLRDDMGESLVSVDICERCGAVYSTFSPED